MSGPNDMKDNINAIIDWNKISTEAARLVALDTDHGMKGKDSIVSNIQKIGCTEVISEFIKGDITGDQLIAISNGVSRDSQEYRDIIVPEPLRYDKQAEQTKRVLTSNRNDPWYDKPDGQRVRVSEILKDWPYQSSDVKEDHMKLALSIVGECFGGSLEAYMELARNAFEALMIPGEENEDQQSGLHPVLFNGENTKLQRKLYPDFYYDDGILSLAGKRALKIQEEAFAGKVNPNVSKLKITNTTYTCLVELNQPCRDNPDRKMEDVPTCKYVSGEINLEGCHGCYMNVDEELSINEKRKLLKFPPTGVETIRTNEMKKFKELSKHIAVVYSSTELIGLIFTHQAKAIRMQGLPDDAVLHSLAWDVARNAFAIFFISREFPITPTGEMLPILEIEYQSLPVSEYMWNMLKNNDVIEEAKDLANDMVADAKTRMEED